VFAPHATHAPKAQPAPPCEGDYCALNALQDLWKRDALKQDRPPDVNANSVILDRARFQKEADRFGAPDATAVFNYNILNSGMCIGAFQERRLRHPHLLNRRRRPVKIGHLHDSYDQVRSMAIR